MDTTYPLNHYQNAVSETAEFLRSLLLKYPPDAAALVLGVVVAQALAEHPPEVQNQFLANFFAENERPVPPLVMTLISTEPT